MNEQLVDLALVFGFTSVLYAGKYLRDRLTPKRLPLHGKRGRVRARTTTISPSGARCAAYEVRLLERWVPPLNSTSYELTGFDPGNPERSPKVRFHRTWTSGLQVNFEDGSVLEVASGAVQLDGGVARRTRKLTPHLAAFFDSLEVELPESFEIEETIVEDGAVVEFVGASDLRGATSGDFRTNVLVPTGDPLFVLP